MKLGLINIHNSDFLKYGAIGANNLAYISSYLKKHLNFEDIFIEIDETKLIEQKPDIIGISSITENFDKAIELANNIKKVSDIPIILGGYHISFLPNSLPKFINIGVIGEGEQTMLELMTLALKNKLNINELSKINGIVYHDEDKKIITPKRKNINILDKIPMPDRKLLKHIKSYQHSILTARGCPFECIFCTASKFWEKVRFHSPERVVLEIEDILKNFPNQSMINIDDDLFAVNIPRLEKIVNLIVREGINTKLSFGVTVRTSVFDEDVCKLLKEMNVSNLFIGFESGSEKVLGYLKGNSTIKHNQNALELCKKYNMNVTGSFIVGSPIETEEDLSKTYWFIKKDFDLFSKVNICYSTPFPSTAFWDYAVQNKKIDESFKDWYKLNMDYTKDSIFINENYTKDDFFYFYKKLKELQKLSTLKRPKDILHIANNIHFEYLKNLYQKLASLLPMKEEILEINNEKYKMSDFFHKFLNFNLVENINLVKNKKEYNSILYIHNLEKSKNFDKEIILLKKHLAKTGKLILVFYNGLYFRFLHDLLYENVKYSFHGVFSKETKNIFTLQKIESLLKKNNILINSIIKNIDDDFKNNESINLLNFYLKNFDVSKNVSESNVISYILICQKKYF